jgi:COMPASS component SWD3
MSVKMTKVLTASAIGLLLIGVITYRQSPLTANVIFSSPTAATNTALARFFAAFTLKGHSNSVWAVAISPDGNSQC